MSSVVLVIHLFLALAIIALVLLQRSEGGGLGLGTGGGLGSFASPQATASVLTRITGICAACFFCTSLILGILAGTNTRGSSGVLDHLDATPAPVTSGVAADAPAPAAKPDAPAAETVPSAPVSE